MHRARDLSMGKPYIDSVETVTLINRQRRENCALGLPSVKKGPLPANARVAVVGYGPSLADTWQDIERGGFDAIWTTSKAHDYLIERGITPHFHTDTDYREHKAYFNTKFDRSVMYRMASQIHPFYTNILTSNFFNVELFHVEQPFGGFFDPRYLRLPAMFDAGLQAAHLAFYLGYRDQEWFGMDASAREKGKAHAGPHEGLEPEYVDIEVAGKPWLTSTLLLRQAFWAEKMLCKQPHMKVKIHGDGVLRPFLLERGKCTVS